MLWIPFAILAKKAVEAYLKYEAEQAARYRCRICWTNNHTTEEHEHPQLNAKRKAELVRCQIALPFLVAAMVGIPGHLFGMVSIPLLVIEGLLLWPIWAWAVAHRFRKEQRKENEKIYELDR